MGAPPEEAAPLGGERCYLSDAAIWFGPYGMRSPLSPNHFGNSRSFSFCCSQELEHGIRTDVGFSRYLPDALPSGSQPLHSLEQLVIVLSLRSPSDASLFPCACQPCLYALADSDPLLLRYGGKDADDGLTEDASRVQILFCKATPVNSIARQPLEMVQRLDRSLTAQAIQTPEQQHVELATAGGLEHALELLPVASFSTGVVPVLMHDRPALSSSEQMVFLGGLAPMWETRLLLHVLWPPCHKAIMLSSLSSNFWVPVNEFAVGTIISDPRAQIRTSAHWRMEHRTHLNTFTPRHPRAATTFCLRSTVRIQRLESGSSDTD